MMPKPWSRAGFPGSVIGNSYVTQAERYLNSRTTYLASLYFQHTIRERPRDFITSVGLIEADSTYYEYKANVRSNYSRFAKLESR